MLARAFAEDPVVSSMAPAGPRMAQLMASEIAHRFPVTDVAVDEEGRLLGAAVWDPPGSGTSPLRLIRTAPGALASMRGRLPQSLASIHALEQERPAEPHWYLAMLGADPLARGRGVASALLRPRLAQADGQKVMMHLETGNEANVPLYERFGFTVTKKISLRAGPTVWAMDRLPRA